MQSMLTRLCFTLVGLGLASSGMAGLSATATMTSTQTGPSTWHYDLTLDDTGSTQIGTFWFSWVPGADLMSSPAGNIESPIYWSGTDTNLGSGDGHAVEWTLLSGYPYSLNPGDVVSGFGFDSSVPPSAFTGKSTIFSTLALTTSYVYIGVPFGTAQSPDPGALFDATPPAPTPEPASMSILGIGAGLLLKRRRSK